MFDNIDTSRKMSELFQQALVIIQGLKKTMLSLHMSLDTDDAGFPHVNVKSVEFPEGWFPLPVETFKGIGNCIVLDKNNEQLVLYYQIKGGSYFVQHSTAEAFSLHVSYGAMTCSVSGLNFKKGTIGQAKPNQLHQFCFPEDTGMTVTFDLA